MRGAVDRRTLLRSGTLAVASVAMPASAHAAALPALVVFDSRVAESRAFAAAFPLAARHDVALGPLALARRLATVGQGRVEGLTGWSDWVMLRSAARGRGLRATAEQAAEAPLSGRRHLFRWSMAVPA
ncbi:hypothetical protein [Novosphingobium pokkalii]|uniref:Uncharacterized protein n=1 Tax=Novosphingobium pokkalii TaxID=1770194 RepID=A0ABV7UY79_9SPHN|nr:hypothetical protein [Novosphingobium pokkalii]GHC95772.1 hypothetical protein GCM10019060_25120 [Novosphingobium pokkalii]